MRCKKTVGLLTAASLSLLLALILLLRFDRADVEDSDERRALPVVESSAATSEIEDGVPGDVEGDSERESATYFGRVAARENRMPVAAARVVLSRAGDTAAQTRYEGRSDRSGVFRAVITDSGTFRVLVDHPSYLLRLLETPVALDAMKGGSHDAGTIELTRGLDLAGSVTAVEAGEGIGAARILLRLEKPPSKGVGLRQATTADDGAFSMVGLSEGKYLADVEADGFVPKKREAVQITAAVRRVAHWKLEVASRISGRVLDASGKPIGTATVRPDIRHSDMSQFGALHGRYGYLGHIKTESDEEGRYVLEGLMPYSGYSITAIHPEYAVGRTEPVALEPRSTVDDVDVVLSGGGAIQGHVTDEDGEGLAGIRLEYYSARAPVMRLFRYSKEREVDSDSEGSFRLAHLVAGVYTVTAYPGKVRSDLCGARVDEIEVVDGETVDLGFELKKGVEITGTVVADDGTPIPDAYLNAWSARRSRTKTDAEGRFRLGGLEPGRVLQIDLYAPKHQSGIENIEAPAEDVLITLKRLRAVRGRVLPPRDESLPAGRVVAVSRNGQQNWGGETRQGSGEFEIHVAPGRYEVLAIVSGFAPARSGEFQVDAGEVVEGIEIELGEGGSVEGTVLERKTGAPVSNASISLGPASPGESSLWEGARETISRADGYFLLEDLPPGRITLRVVHADFAPKSVAEVSVTVGRIERVRIELGSGGSVRGVVKRRGQTVAGVAFISRHDGIESISRTADVGENGRFEFHDLPPGRYLVTAGHAGARQGEIVALAAGETRELEITFDTITRVFGQIRVDGEPFRGRQVRVSNARGVYGQASEIDASGSYQVVLPGAAKYTLIVGSVPVSLTVPARTDEMRFDIELASGAVSGTLLDGVTGSPVRASVRAVAFGTRLASRHDALGWAGSDASGRFQLRHLAAGRYSLLIEAAGYAEQRVDGVRVLEGQDTDVGEVALERGVPVTVSVVSESGKPIAVAQILLRDERGKVWCGHWRLQTDSSGQAELSAVKPGTYRVTAVHASYAPGSVGLIVGEEVVRTTITLESGGYLEFKVLDADASPANTCEIFVLDARGHNVLEDVPGLGFPHVPNLTDQNGRLRSTRLRPGLYRTYARADQRRSDEVEVAVRRQDTTTVELRLGSSDER